MSKKFQTFRRSFFFCELYKNLAKIPPVQFIYRDESSLGIPGILDILCPNYYSLYCIICLLSLTALCRTLNFHNRTRNKHFRSVFAKCAHINIGICPLIKNGSGFFSVGCFHPCAILRFCPTW